MPNIRPIVQAGEALAESAGPLTKTIRVTGERLASEAGELLGATPRIRIREVHNADAPEMIAQIMCPLDKEVLESLKRIPVERTRYFKGPLAFDREFLVTSGRNPQVWEHATMRGDRSLQLEFTVREMLPSIHIGSSRLGPPQTALLQHFSGIPGQLNNKLARDADLIFCCHAERLPFFAKSKHALSELVGPVQISTQKKLFSQTRTGDVTTIGIKPWVPGAGVTVR